MFSKMMRWENLVTTAGGYLGLGMAEEARDTLEDLPPEDLTRPEVLLLRFQIHALQGEWPLAEEIAALLVERHPGNPEHWLARAAAARHMVGREEAEEILRRAVVLHTTHGGIWYALAGLASLFGRIDDALSLLQQALRLDPSLRAQVWGDETMLPIWNEIARSSGLAESEQNIP